MIMQVMKKIEIIENSISILEQKMDSTINRLNTYEKEMKNMDRSEFKLWMKRNNSGNTPDNHFHTGVGGGQQGPLDQLRSYCDEHQHKLDHGMLPVVFPRPIRLRWGR